MFVNQVSVMKMMCGFSFSTRSDSSRSFSPFRDVAFVYKHRRLVLELEGTFDEFDEVEGTYEDFDDVEGMYDVFDEAEGTYDDFDVAEGAFEEFVCIWLVDL